MKDVGSPPASPEPPLPPPRRSGCLTATMVIFGIILLLPGWCWSALFRSGLGKPNHPPIPDVLYYLWFAGAALIVSGIAIAIYRLERRR